MHVKLSVDKLGTAQATIICFLCLFAAGDVFAPCHCRNQQNMSFAQGPLPSANNCNL